VPQHIWDVRVGAVWRVLHGTYAWAARVGVYVRRERALIALDPEVQGPGGMGNHNKTVKAHVETSERGLKLKSHQGRGKYFTGAGNGALKQDF